MAVMPAAHIGNGIPDMSKIRVLPNGSGYQALNGSLYLVGYQSNGQDIIIPDGMNYLSFYPTFPSQDESTPHCKGTNGDKLCGFKITPGDSMETVYKKINAKQWHNMYLLGDIGVQWNDPRDSICGAWVLSSEPNVKNSSYVVGNIGCGTQPGEVSCVVTPYLLDIDLGIVTGGNKVEIEKLLEVKCTGGKGNIILRTTGTGDGGSASLSGANDSLTANIFLEGQNAGSGISLTVDDGKIKNVKLKVEVKTESYSSGLYQGSIPLLMLYQ